MVGDLSPGEERVYKYNGENCHEILLSPGNYKFEVWGAQGGSQNGDTGLGGYASAYVQYHNQTLIYGCVGGKGTFSINPKGGFNGGGDGFAGSLSLPSGSGGGSTDLRYYKDIIETRFLVAGAGGGEGNFHSSLYAGGYGGGKSGGDGETWLDSINGNGGGQISGGRGAVYNVGGMYFETKDGKMLYGSTAIGDEYSGGGGGA